MAPGPELRDGDMLLICSDGLHDLVNVDHQERAEAASQNVEQAVKMLIQAALDAGGHDNVSVVAVRLDEVEEDLG